MYLMPLSRHANDFSRSVDRLFNDGLLERYLGSATPAEGDAARSPALDVTESEQGYLVQVDLPGVSKQDVKVQIEGRCVQLSAQPGTASEPREGDRVLHRERGATRFARSLTLPVDIDQTASEARMEHGVLTLKLVKRGAHAAHLPVQ